MHSRASALIQALQLTSHPEGGYFREVFRSTSLVTTRSGGTQRTAITSIYYLLPAGQVSKFHRVTSDEVWHFLEGDPLELYTLDPNLTTLQMHLLGPVTDNAQPIHTVPADHWQAAMPKGLFTLAGCTVGPGFEYEDFSLLSQSVALSQKLKQQFPSVARLL